MDVGVRSSNDIYDPIGKVGWLHWVSRKIVDERSGCPAKASAKGGHPIRDSHAQYLQLTYSPLFIFG
jgi:hypothetical protein